MSALRTSRSHALQPLRFNKQIAAPVSKADDEELQSNLKAQVNVEKVSIRPEIDLIIYKPLVNYVHFHVLRTRPKTSLAHFLNFTSKMQATYMILFLLVT